MLMLAEPRGTPWSQFAPRFDSVADWPEAARLALDQLLSAGPAVTGDARSLPRHVYHLRAELALAGAAAVAVYTRDVNAWDVGFVLPTAVPVGAKAVVRLVAPDGRRMRIGCRVRRCRPLAGNWHEGYAEFCQPQYSLENVSPPGG